MRAASITGELSLLSYRDEAALSGKVAFKARWLAFAALLSLHPAVDPQPFAQALGCGPTPLRGLQIARSQGWWDEACVHRLFIELARAEGEPPSIEGQESTRRAVVSLLLEGTI